jgi:hypothetical protein
MTIDGTADVADGGAAVRPRARSLYAHLAFKIPDLSANEVTCGIPVPEEFAAKMKAIADRVFGDAA